MKYLKSTQELSTLINFEGGIAAIELRYLTTLTGRSKVTCACINDLHRLLKAENMEMFPLKPSARATSRVYVYSKQSALSKLFGKLQEPSLEGAAFLTELTRRTHNEVQTDGYNLRSLR